jgi:SAM-dependent methyltransferase
MIREWADLSGYILDDGCGLGTYLDALEPFTPCRFGLEVELDRAVKALPTAEGNVLAVGEAIPFAPDTFDFLLSNEVIEHVQDDALALKEMVRVVKPGGRIIIFCPNRWYPVEQHGIFWRGRYKFGNIPLVNYLPNPLRNRLAPHVRTYSAAALRKLYQGLPVKVVHYGRIFGGYDNIERRWPRFGRLLKKTLYTLEKTPFSIFGIRPGWGSACSWRCGGSGSWCPPPPWSSSSSA